MKEAFRVLWAEDDHDDLLLICEAADALQVTHLIDFVPNGKEAIINLQHSLIDKCLPQLIVLDNNMPVVSGFETLNWISTNRSLTGIPVVFFTSVTTGAEVEIISKTAKVFQKPSAYTVFLNTVKEILALCKV